MNPTVTQRGEFECSYILAITPGKPQLHSHRYKIEVTAGSESPYLNDGVVIQFEDMKRIINSIIPDHTFLYNSQDIQNYGILSSQIAKLLLENNIPAINLKFTPYTENLVNYFAERIQIEFNKFHPNVSVIEVKLREDNSSFATWRKDNI